MCIHLRLLFFMNAADTGQEALPVELFSRAPIAVPMRGPIYPRMGLRRLTAFDVL